MFNWKNLFGDDNSGEVKKVKPIVEKINSLESLMQEKTDQELEGMIEIFRNRHKEGETLDDLLPEAFAVVRESSVRHTGLRHYDVQLIGGILLHKGKIAEMRTGEGKTLVATLPSYLNAIAQKGVHVVTVNDYLARRDAVWVGQIYSRLGLSVGVINSAETSYLYDTSHREDIELDEERDEKGDYKIFYEYLKPCSRIESYEADITYGTNSEFGFDYLRDNITHDPKSIRQKNLSFAIVDEMDSVLIDEARTPLIISGPVTETESLYEMFAKMVISFEEDKDYTVDEKYKQIALTEDGISKAEKALNIENLYTEGGLKYIHHLETAVKAKSLMIKEKDYVIKNGEVVIVDEFTGRMQEGRRWSNGMHQAVEAKEGLTIQKESKTYASVTYQNFFRMYEKLCGMTGTAETSKEEFFKVYKLDVVVVPTNKPIARIDNDDLIYQTENGKFTAIARKVKELNQKGQPILIGTASVEKSEMLSVFLKKENISHEILNAKNHEREGEIVAEAGRKGAVTVATNMAGRGVDIKLGGADATQEQEKEILELGGLYVMGTERHDARRIDNQLRGRSGRQGDPGETQFFVSMEDTLMRIFATDTVKNMMGRMGLAEDEPIKAGMITRSLENAQNRIEGMHFDSRKQILQFDDVLNTQRKSIYKKRKSFLLGQDSDIKKHLEDIFENNSDLKNKYDSYVEKLGEEKTIDYVRRIYLETVDVLWMDHLENMEFLRSSVSLRSYGQRDPFLEYKKEGLIYFKQLEQDLNDIFVDKISRLNVDGILQNEARVQQKQSAAAIAAQKAIDSTNKSEDSSGKTVVKSKDQKIGRNDPCWCGSGKKYKHCHGKK